MCPQNSSDPEEKTPKTGRSSKATLPTTTSTPLTLRQTSKPDISTPWSLDSVLSTLTPKIPSQTPPTPIPFFHLLTRLKSTPREGWRRLSLTNTESIADHMYRMSLITLLAPPSLASRISIPHCMKMALVHDMAESIVGDITPLDGVPKIEKCRRETESMDFLTNVMLGGIADCAEAADGIREIWQEYENHETMEAKFVHDVDKFELLLQMMEYERREEGKLDLGEFSNVAEKIEFLEVKVWCAEVLREREEFWKGCGKKPMLLDEGRKIIDMVEREQLGKT